MRRVKRRRTHESRRTFCSKNIENETGHTNIICIIYALCTFIYIEHHLKVSSLWYPARKSFNF